MAKLIPALLVLLLGTINIGGRLFAKPPIAERLGIGFYNLENLYDTIANPFKGDDDYTPSGKNNWGTDRYTRKLQNLGRVIDQMNMDVLGICEVESEAALRDLVRTLKTDYNYIHRTSGDFRGMDIGMLYKGDKFVPENIRQIYSSYSREFLYVRGLLLGERIDFIVCHMPSNFNDRPTRTRVMARLVSVVDSLRRCDASARVVLMGDFNAVPTDRLMRKQFGTDPGAMSGGGFMFNPFHKMGRDGLGTYVFDDRWVLFDNIMVGNGLLGGDRLRYYTCGIFIKDYMISDGLSLKRRYPMRTFTAGKYLGGYSDHLPVYIILER